MKRYQVIGGQYEPFWYGESDTLRGASGLPPTTKSIGTTGKGGTSPRSMRQRTWKSWKSTAGSSTVTVPESVCPRTVLCLWTISRIGKRRN